MILRKIVIIILVVILGSVAIFGIIKLKKEKEFNHKLEEFISFQAYILPEYENNAEEIGEKIKDIKGIKSVEFISKDEAFNRMQEELGEEASEGLDSTIFPCSFVIHCEIKELKRTYFEEIENKIENIEGIENISSNYETVITIYNNQGKEALKNFINNIENIDKFLEEYID